MSATNVRYNLTVTPAIEETTRHINFEFESRSELKAAMNTVADLLLFLQDDLKVMKDYSNCLTTEQKINNGPWEEIEI